MFDCAIISYEMLFAVDCILIFIFNIDCIYYFKLIIVIFEVLHDWLCRWRFRLFD